MKKRQKRMFLSVFAVLLVAVLLFLYIRFANGSLIYISTGLKKTVMFKVDGMSASMMEARILMADAARDYENVYGKTIWNENIGDVSVDDYVKDKVKNELYRVYCMNLLAKEKGVVLSRAQEEAIDNAAADYYNSMDKNARDSLSVTVDKLKLMFRRFIMAEMLYDDMTIGYNIEVSTDEARVIQIQYICSDSEDKIRTAKSRLDNGEVFYVVAMDYNPDEYDKEIRRGQFDKVFEDAAFELGTGEISDIFKVGDLYYIVKCKSDNDKSKTDANKIALVEQKKLEYFNSTFEKYEAGKYIELNTSVWENEKLATTVDTGASFQEIFKRYFE